MIDLQKIETNHRFIVVYFSTTEKQEVWIPCKDKTQLARTLYNLSKNNIKGKAYHKGLGTYLSENEIGYIVETYKKALDIPRWWNKQRQAEPEITFDSL